MRYEREVLKEDIKNNNETIVKLNEKNNYLQDLNNRIINSKWFKLKRLLFFWKKYN